MTTEKERAEAFTTSAQVPDSGALSPCDFTPSVNPPPLTAGLPIPNTSFFTRFFLDRHTFIVRLRGESECRRFAHYAQNCPAFSERRPSGTHGFRYAWKLQGGGYLEYGDKASGACKTGGALRLDYNPAKTDLAAVPGLARFLGGSWRHTRVDAAVDLNLDLADAVLLHESLRACKTYRSPKDGRLETIYFGSSQSAKQLRVYNKGREQAAKGGDDLGFGDRHWRLETQHRPSGLEVLPETLFDGLRVLMLTGLEDLKCETRLLLQTIAADPAVLWSFDTRARKRFRGLLDDHAVELDPSIPALYREQRERLLLDLFLLQVSAQGGEIHESGIPSLAESVTG